jgi:uncharacterized integral membrane protein
MGQTVTLTFVRDFQIPLILWTLILFALGAFSATLIFISHSLRKKKKE